ncbi:hypothetical protein cgp_2533 [Corynebacterium glutamicum MB001]|uniref:Uncharacterized protein n=1 Tax=Corynebacterium glutamicum (strain ATCC 13032 / DSM 20300 / JCM 1318 / BCRC 11384 / CCUG 27702 / LMG 3730 / NBRC 12168 / NCIMB 10025 / NRRL B-2784 / 534) TaxID=196627 RepID=Q8NN98_CORGL|nr:hypothetical protein [Corynebacterium glutamicum]AGT06036.1 hypothetical protein cgp_2533 [Corynebacterium glutamicum MB001]AIK88519.1 hypothetical protein AR0_11030 [Corynebacterium glutamicum]ASW14676.1 hypothetical protein cgc1_2533 [Corynebacterium glutamicum]AUI01741.1 hypothetical protein CYL77_11600 [Corynebacterium glutamicum]AUI05414.1 hypothetical protein C0I99_15445 [Corynebacterium glutamicum]
MTLKIDPSSISSAVSRLNELQHQAITASQVGMKSTILSAFSPVSGLDQLGSGHGNVINGGAGAANSVLNSYAEQIEWLSAALQASGAALTGQDELFARGMDVADTGGRVVEESVMFPARPAPRFESFVFNPPAVSPSLSLDALCSQFSGTNSGAVLEAQGSWGSMASAISNVSASLSSIAGEILAENSGETFEQAAARINEVAAAGATFAANAKMMGASVGTLNRIYMGHRMQVFMAATSIKAILDPVQRLAAERAFLASFQATFQADVLTGMPPVSNLMQMKGANGSAGEIALGMDEIAGSGQAWSAAGLTPSGAAQGGVANAGSIAPDAAVQGAAGQSGVGSFGTVTDQLDGINIGDMLTSAASAGQSLANGLAMPTSTPNSASGAIPSSMSAASPLGAFGSGAGLGAQGGSIGSSAPGAISSRAAGSAGGSVPGMTGGPGAPGITSDSLMGARTHGASSAGAVAPMMGGAGGMSGGVVGAGGTGSQSKYARQTGSSVGSSSQSGSGLGMVGSGSGKPSISNFGRGMMPMMPMMPMGGAGGGQKNTGKVKTVTSAVEEDRNLAALLGDRGPVVPGVIGDWVRG